jgi:aspartyl-tRNA(Asn)/glutamyl-tRNA(Gln) amidotransferase subunit A
MTKSVSEHVESVRNGSVKIDEFIQEVMEKSEKMQKSHSPFITINKNPETLGKNKKGKLLGLPVSIKDNICTNGIQTTAGSKILAGYIPPFDATAVAQMKEQGGIIIGKTAMDEFGFGTFCTNGAYSIPKNPYDPQRSCGGSSGGAGCLTALADFPHIALAQSTGGSITAPAAFTGTVGLTPTYGRVSRYGLIDYASSMDKIGVMAKEVYDTALMLSVISGYDPLDSTSSETAGEDFTKYVEGGVKGMKLGIPKEYMQGVADERIAKAVMAQADKLEQLGAKVEEVSLQMTKYTVPSYYLIAISEASTNLAKFCGLRYGLQEEMHGDFEHYFAAIRSKGFGIEAKRRIILGTYARMAGFRDAYYIKALKVRTKVTKEFKQLLGKYDGLIAPSMPMLAPKFSDIEKLTPIQAYGMDLLTLGSNMAGLPNLSVPIGKIDGLPVGMQIITDHFKEGKMIQIGGSVKV